MPNYNEWEKRADHGAGFRKKSFGGRDNRGFGGGRDRFDKPKFQAVCVECGERCEVPFRPVQGKPVYCDNCFRRDERGGDRGFHKEDRGGRFEKRFDRNESRGGDANRTEFEQLNRKLDAIMELLKNVKSQNSTVHTVAKKEESEAAPEAVQTEEAKPSKKKAAKKSEDKPEKAEKKAAKKAKK